MEFNKFQTPIEDLVYNRVVDDKLVPIKFKDAPKEVQDTFWEYMSTVPMVQWLTSSERPYIQDLPRDKNGRAIWDIERPPIIENTDFFRPTALHFQSTGRLTDLRPNGNPNSEYRKWVDEEVRRIREGYLRESDGAYISGWMYWYLNYCPIILTEIEEGTNIGYRTTDFPEFWEGIHWRYTGWDKARSLGQHFAEISKRGSSKSYTMASALSRIFVIGEKETKSKNFLEKTSARAVVMAYQKEFLIKDGTLNKFEDMFAFQAQNTQFPRKTLKSSLNDMDWVMGYLDLNTGTKRGTGNEVLGVAVKDDVDKGRGKRAQLIGLEEFGKFPNVADVIKIAEPSVKEGDITFGTLVAIGTGGEEGCLTDNNFIFLSDGRLVHPSEIVYGDSPIGYNIEKQECRKEAIERMKLPAKKQCIKITTNSFRTIECSIDHPIYSSNHYNASEVRVWEWLQAGTLKIGDLVAIAQEVPFFGEDTVFDPYLLGLLVGDGCYITSPRIISCDSEIHKYLEDNYRVKIYNHPYETKDGKIVKEYGIKGIRDELRALGIYGQSKERKRVPEKIFSSSKQSVCDFIAGLIDTDGCITICENKKGNRKPVCAIQYSSAVLPLVQQVQLLLMKLGVYGTVLKKKPSNKEKKIKDKSCYYTLLISSARDVVAFQENVRLRIQYKQDRLNLAASISKSKKRWRKQSFNYETIKTIEILGERTVYNMMVASDHTYLGNGIITHNTDFSGALDLIYHPSGSHFISFENVWDKSSLSRGTSIFCFPAYVNRKGCYNKDGISDVTKALYSLCFEYYIAKYENPDPIQVTRTKAENPVTLQDAIMRKDGSKFPVAQITQRIQEIDLNPNFFDDIAVGDLVMTSSGKVEYRPSAGTPIHKFPTKDNKVEGAIEFFKFPEYNSDGKVFSNRYIAGIDPVQNDEAKTMSLVSLFVLDLWTDTIVCEWTGRLKFTDDCYERARLICIFYNATLLFENNKMGVYGHFKMMNSLYLLAKTPEHLKAIDKVKTSGSYGNSSYGVSASTPVNDYARDLLIDFMLKPVPVVTDEGESTILNLMTWWNRAALEEARQWNPDGNFDRISALGMLMIYRTERMVMTYGNVKEEHSGASKANDPFFEKNYKPKKR